MGRAAGRRTEQHGIDRYVEDVLAVADALGEPRSASSGTRRARPSAIGSGPGIPTGSLGLVGLGAVGPGPSEDEEDLELAARIRGKARDALVTWLLEESRTPEWFADQMRSTDPEMFALLLEAWASWGGPWRSSRRSRRRRSSSWGSGGGRNDDAAAHARRAAETLPDGRAVVIPELGHVMAFVRADLVLPHVRGSSATSHRCVEFRLNLARFDVRLIRGVLAADGTAEHRGERDDGDLGMTGWGERRAYGQVRTPGARTRTRTCPGYPS
jgi:hypothetical protein